MVFLKPTRHPPAAQEVVTTVTTGVVLTTAHVAEGVAEVDGVVVVVVGHSLTKALAIPWQVGSVL